MENFKGDKYYTQQEFDEATAKIALLEKDLLKFGAILKNFFAKFGDKLSEDKIYRVAMLGLSDTAIDDMMPVTAREKLEKVLANCLIAMEENKINVNFIYKTDDKRNKKVYYESPRITTACHNKILAKEESPTINPSLPKAVAMLGKFNDLFKEESFGPKDIIGDEDNLIINTENGKLYEPKIVKKLERDAQKLKESYTHGANALLEALNIVAIYRLNDKTPDEIIDFLDKLLTDTLDELMTNGNETEFKYFTDENGKFVFDHYPSITRILNGEQFHITDGPMHNPQLSEHFKSKKYPTALIAYFANSPKHRGMFKEEDVSIDPNDFIIKE